MLVVICIVSLCLDEICPEHSQPAASPPITMLRGFVVLAGAPSKQSLLEHWPAHVESQTAAAAAPKWRILSPFAQWPLLSAPETSCSEIDLFFEKSYAVHHLNASNDPCPTMDSTGRYAYAAPNPLLEFDIRAITELEDLPHIHVVDNWTHRRLYSLIVAILDITVKVVSTKFNPETQLLTLLVGDPTQSLFEVACWQCNWSDNLRRQDVILLESMLFTLLLLTC
ncbi:hypothetical protein NEOLI_002844 [Neolecta irregularis DAH-3]|uniref:Uncharacterized protein n=1 Tax=Neolecta irregularis (strain DAH-3) TaxID=1198029 RepID=A0A1U7LQB5_NEOID|nr:hypothetical protein NEOLI_002844 [Neolecta irregularis DAH-3]|eukprot:OLL24847.1 hypothetical protein NEOLI_002844 [Neolecta irregularis DAH-3]